MIISRKKKAIILRLRDPTRVTSVIPTSKQFTFKGSEYVAVKHGVEEVKVLRNIGINAPSPINYYYDWPGRFQPFDHQKVTAAFMSLENRAFNLNGMGCVDSETEYLSPTGWVRIADYVGGSVAQYVPGTEAIEFVQPEEYVKLPCPEMVRIKTKYGLDQLLSPEHRVLVRAKTNRDKTEVLPAIEVLARQMKWASGEAMPKGVATDAIAFTQMTVPVTGYAAGGAGIQLTNEELRVQIAVIADGHFSNATNRCVVRLKKERKKLRLRSTLTAAGVAWKEREQNTATAQGFTVFTFQAPIRVKEFDSSFWAATPEQLYVVCDEVMHWDGTDGVAHSPGKGYCFSSTVRASADFVQYAYSATGRVARLSESTRERRGRIEVEYTVTVRLNGPRDLMMVSRASDGSKHETVTLAPSTDGFKYCFVVPSTFLLFRRNGCVFASGNTGKTLATLWAYDYLRSRGLVNKALVVTPLSTLERTWADEVFQHFPHLETSVLHGSREKRLALLESDADIYLVNHDGIKVSGFVEALKDRTDIDLIIIDEIAQVGRNSGTDKFRALLTLCNRQVPRRVWGLTGTPTPNKPTDAWAQCRLLVPEKVPPYFNRFKDQVMRQINQFLWVPRENAVEVVHEAMQPSIRFSLEECIDLPECVYQTRTAELTTEQKKAYKEMLTRLRIEAASGAITAANEAVKAQKLLQVVMGIIYDGNGNEVILDAGPRMDVILEAIEQSGSKAIVFVPFVSSVRSVLAAVRGAGYTAEAIYGDVSKNERDRILGDFQTSDAPHVIVAQPATMSHGLNLTAASTIIWGAPISSNDIFQQANARISRPGQKLSQLIVMIEGTDIERKYYKRLKDKQAVQGLLLDMVQDSRIPA